MVYNDATPVIDVNPETYVTFVDGVKITSKPAKKITFNSAI